MCLAWADVASFALARFPDAGLGDADNPHNYCRNPENQDNSTVWCYVDESYPRVEYCDIGLPWDCEDGKFLN